MSSGLELRNNGEHECDYVITEGSNNTHSTYASLSPYRSTPVTTHSNCDTCCNLLCEESKENPPSLMESLDTQYIPLSFPYLPPPPPASSSTFGPPPPPPPPPSTGSNEEFYCQICFEPHHKINEGYELSLCHHVFCKSCLILFLKSKIDDGQVYPKCFHMSEIHTKPDHTNPTSEINSDEVRSEYNINSPEPSPMRINPEMESTVTIERIKNGEEQYETVDVQTIVNHTCNVDISSIDIHILLSKDEANKPTLEKYNRFKFCKENKNARECPSCATYNLGTPDITPEMTCSNCATKYCYYHSNAHDFNVYKTCAAYEESISKETKLNTDYIVSFSKACPSCGVMVMKSGGCNHMKCQCGAAFCWLCGKQIEDTLFPAHFQWWNPTGCTNLQMNESIEPPSLRIRIFARTMSILQLILIGPITLVSTIVSTFLCFSCICYRLKTHKNVYPTFLNGVESIMSNCMSSWGLFWMILLIFLPLGIIVGSVFASIIAVILIITYPCYAVIRLQNREYPWPDAVTEVSLTIFRFLKRILCQYDHNQLSCWSRYYYYTCWRCCHRLAPLPPLPASTTSSPHMSLSFSSSNNYNKSSNRSAIVSLDRSNRTYSLKKRADSGSNDNDNDSWRYDPHDLEMMVDLEKGFDYNPEELREDEDEVKEMKRKNANKDLIPDDAILSISKDKDNTSTLTASKSTLNNNNNNTTTSGGGGFSLRDLEEINNLLNLLQTLRQASTASSTSTANNNSNEKDNSNNEENNLSDLALNQQKIINTEALIRKEVDELVKKQDYRHYSNQNKIKEIDTNDIEAQSPATVTSMTSSASVPSTSQTNSQKEGNIILL